MIRASIIKLLVHIHYLFPIHFPLREEVRISFYVSDTRLVEVGGTRGNFHSFRLYQIKVYQ